MAQQFIVGIAASWQIDRNGTLFARGAFARSIRLLTAGRLQIPLLLDHDPRKPIGEVLELIENDEGLEMTASFDAELPGGSELTQMSAVNGVGLSTRSWHGDAMRRQGDGFVEILDGVIAEISVAVDPANAVRRLQLLSEQIYGSVAGGEPRHQHAPLPDVCAECAALLGAQIARPVPAFDFWQHCEHRATLTEASVAAGDVVSWTMTSPISRAQFDQRVRARHARS